MSREALEQATRFLVLSQQPPYLLITKVLTNQPMRNIQKRNPIPMLIPDRTTPFAGRSLS